MDKIVQQSFSVFLKSRLTYAAPQRPCASVCRSVRPRTPCTAPVETITITVNANPTIVNASATDVCEGEDLFLTADNGIAGTGDLTYTWTGPNFTYTATVGENEPMTATLIGATAADSGIYTLTVESAAACSASTTVDVTINANPVLIDVGGGGNFCEGDETVLTVTNTETNINEIT